MWGGRRHHALALVRRRVAGAHPGPDLDIRLALRSRSFCADAGERRLEVPLDIVGERLQRRDIDDLRLVLEPAIEALPHEIVDRRHEGGKRLARTGRGGDQDVTAGLDERPRFCLRWRRQAEPLLEPRRNGRMKKRLGQHAETHEQQARKGANVAATKSASPVPMIASAWS